MNAPDLPEDSDTSDDDYVPDEKPEAVSEVESDGDPDNYVSDSDSEEKISKKRSKGRSKAKKKQKKLNERVISDADTSHLDSTKELKEEEKKKLAEDIWADFMKDTGFQSRKSSTITAQKEKPKETDNGKAEIKPNSSKLPGTVKITQLFEFAGEEVKVEKEVPVNSAEARLLSKSNSTQPDKGRKGSLSGISNVLSQLGKKPKISTLEKSKLDWDKFKKEENLEEELQTHNKGKDGYLERQDFLQRADVRRFEIEKKLRTIERNKRLNN